MGERAMQNKAKHILCRVRYVKFMFILGWLIFGRKKTFWGRFLNWSNMLMVNTMMELYGIIWCPGMCPTKTRSKLEGLEWLTCYVC